MPYFTYKDASNQWRWRLRTANQHIIAMSSEGYYNRTDYVSTIELVKSSKDALFAMNNRPSDE